MPELTRITSRSNARLVHFRKVRDGRVPGEIFLEGLRLGEEALRSGLKILDCVIAAETAGNSRFAGLVARLMQQGVPVAEISCDINKTLADTISPQGIFIIAERPSSAKDQIDVRVAEFEHRLVVYLSEASDPSNLGGIFRTAEAAGVAGVIISSGSADAFLPKVNRAALGANLRLPVWEGVSAAEIVAWARANRLRTRAADIAGKVAYTELDWKAPSIVVFGSEAHGLEESFLQEMDEVFLIPVKNGVESLNLSVSAGIVLFEALRQNS